MECAATARVAANAEGAARRRSAADKRAAEARGDPPSSFSFRESVSSRSSRGAPRVSSTVDGASCSSPLASSTASSPYDSESCAASRVVRARGGTRRAAPKPEKPAVRARPSRHSTMSRSGSGGRSEIRSTTGREAYAPHAPSRTRASASAVHRASPPGPSTCRSLRRGRDGVSGWGKTGGDVRVPRRHPRDRGRKGRARDVPRGVGIDVPARNARARDGGGHVPPRSRFPRPAAPPRARAEDAMRARRACSPETKNESDDETERARRAAVLPITVLLL